jgi:hypothetical protein
MASRSQPSGDAKSAATEAQPSAAERQIAIAFGMYETLREVAPYLAERGQKDDVAWGLYSRVIRALTKAEGQS